jgi:hypothetical protein
MARAGHSPNIPCMPAILLARRLACGDALPASARPCLELIDLDEFRGASASLDSTAFRH